LASWLADTMIQYFARRNYICSV